jgi:hypothetical protein
MNLFWSWHNFQSLPKDTIRAQFPALNLYISIPVLEFRWFLASELQSPRWDSDQTVPVAACDVFLISRTHHRRNGVAGLKYMTPTPGCSTWLGPALGLTNIVNTANYISPHQNIEIRYLKLFVGSCVFIYTPNHVLCIRKTIRARLREHCGGHGNFAKVRPIKSLTMRPRLSQRINPRKLRNSQARWTST